MSLSHMARRDTYKLAMILKGNDTGTQAELNYKQLYRLCFSAVQPNTQQIIKTCLIDTSDKHEKDGGRKNKKESIAVFQLSTI